MVIEKLNNRPRKKNGFIKPIDMIKEKKNLTLHLLMESALAVLVLKK